MNKKIVSFIAAAAMSISLIPQALAAPTTATEDFTDNTTHWSGGYQWLGGTLTGIAINNGGGFGSLFDSSGNYKYNFYAADGVLGKDSGDKSFKMSANLTSGRGYVTIPTDGSVASTAPLGGLTTNGETFYIQKNVYIGNLEDGFHYRDGGELSMGNTRNIARTTFGDDGVIRKDNAKTSEVLVDKYEEGNWYNVTMEFVGNTVNGVAYTNLYRTYINGKLIFTHGAPTWGNSFFKVYNQGILSYYDGTSPTTPANPNWVVIDDWKTVVGAYTPADSDTDLSSTEYTVTNPTYLASGSQSNAKISDVKEGTLVSKLKSNIVAPANGSIKVVTINPKTNMAIAPLDGDDLKTVGLADTDVVTGDTKVVSISKDGSMKIYDVETYIESTADADVEACAYTLDADNKTISDIPRFTSVERLLKDVTLSAGATAKVMSIIDTELTDGYINDTMRLRVTSNDGTVSNDYSLSVYKKNITDYRGSQSYLRDQNIGLLQKLIGHSGATVDGVTYSGATANKKTTMAGFYGGLRSNFSANDTTSELTYSKVIDSEGAQAYEFVNPTTYSVYRALSNKTLVPYNDDKGDNIVVEYTIQPMAEGRYVTAFDLLIADSDNGTEKTTYPESVTGRATPNISFQTDNGVNNIKFGVRENADGYNTTIGTWEIGKKYNVVIALKRLNADVTDAFYVKGVWINDEKIENLGNGVAVENNYWKLNNSTNAQAAYATNTPSSIVGDAKRSNHKGWAWHSVAFSSAAVNNTTAGKVNYSNIEIYTANDYVPEKEIEVAITSDELEVYENDKILNRATIKGFRGTVSDVKSALSCTDGAVIRFFDKDGNLITDETVTATAGMTAEVIMVDGTAKKSYMLSDRIDFGTYKVYDSTGILEIESLEEADGALTIKRTVKEYNAEDLTNYCLVVAVYDMYDRMKDVTFVNQDEYDPEEEGLNIELDLSEYTEEVKVKAMLLDTFTGMMPYSTAMIITNEGITGNTAENTNLSE